MPENDGINIVKASCFHIILIVDLLILSGSNRAATSFDFIDYAM